MLFARRDALPDIQVLADQLEDLLLRPLFRKYATHPPRIAHYTSLGTLDAILSSGNLRMTHFRHLNDSTEMLHGRRVVNELLASEASSGNDTSHFFDYSRFFFNELDDLAIQYFVTSFSELSDSADLWARYGGRGAGVAITFDTARMGASATEPAPYYIGRVTYTADEQRMLLAPLVEAAKVVISRYIKRHGYDVRDVAVQMLAAKLCSHLNHHSISLKDSVPWSVEHEWRTVFSVLANDPIDRQARVQRWPDGKPFVDVPVHSVQPYDPRMPIATVTVGSATDVSRAESILHTHGYTQVVVRVSRITAADLPKWP